MRASIEAFLAEDVGRGDVTTGAVVVPDARAQATVIAKTDLVVAGLEAARIAFAVLDPDAAWNAECRDGDARRAGAVLARLSARAGAILSAERVALNLLQRMSGIATATRRYVDALRGTRCAVLDTRKTAPGLRIFDKAAVAAGGGRNHRFGLDDGILIKDNHLALAGSVAAAVERARRFAPPYLKVEVEVESEAALRDALGAGADALLLDNRTVSETSALVAVARGLRPDVSLESSGGITLENARAYAETGIDFLSVGALTHSVSAADVSLEICGA